MPEKDRSSLVSPLTLDTELDNKLHTISYPTMYTFDNKPVTINFTISDETNMTWISVHDIDVEIVEKLGVHFRSRMDQCWLDGTAIMADKIKLCKGKSVYFHLESTVPRCHIWTNIITAESWNSVHSKNCELIMPFTRTKKKWLCDFCVHDLGYVQ